MEREKTGDREERIDDLRQQVAFLREQLDTERESRTEERRRHDTVLAQLSAANAEQARTIRELIEAPQEAPDDAETVEETPPERAEPRSATGGAQEGTVHPQQRGGWLAPVDNLPWWHYAIGLFFAFSAGFLASLAIDALITVLPSGILAFEFFLAIVAITVAITCWPPTMFGLWVGYRKKNLRLWPQVLPLGALVGGVTSLGAKFQLVGLSFVLLPSLFSPESLIFVLPAWLLFVSASLIGNAWQRRRIGRISDTTPASPVFRAGQGAGRQPRKDLTPAQQAMLGWGGGIIGALIGLVGTIIQASSGS